MRKEPQGGGGVVVGGDLRQVMMSAPWSVREQVFSLKMSWKDSICLRDACVQALGVLEALAPTGGALLEAVLLGWAPCLPGL